MRLTFLGKDSQPNQSPTLYATDQETYVVQGWIMTDPDVLAELDLADDETVVEVPRGLLSHLSKEGLSGEVVTVAPPIVRVLENGHYLVQGRRVMDAEALGQMDIPGHETCIEVARSAVVELVGG